MVNLKPLVGGTVVDAYVEVEMHLQSWRRPTGVQVEISIISPLKQNTSPYTQLQVPP